MNKRITRVSPLQCGKVLGVLYGCMTLVFIPFFLLFFLLAPHTGPNGNNLPLAVGVVFMVLAPFFYALAGFIAGVIAAAIYNLVAGWTGGIEFTVVDVAPVLPTPTGYPVN